MNIFLFNLYICKCMFFYFTDLIKPICLPVMSKMRKNMLVKYEPYVAGWGTQQFRKYFMSAQKL